MYLILPQIYYYRKFLSLPTTMASDFDFADLCQRSILTLTQSCETCDVDFERGTGYYVDPKKAFRYAVVGLLRKDNTVKAKDVYLVPVSELSNDEKTLCFDDPEKRVSSRGKKGTKPRMNY